MTKPRKTLREVSAGFLADQAVTQRRCELLQEIADQAREIDQPKPKSESFWKDAERWGALVRDGD